MTPLNLKHDLVQDDFVAEPARRDWLSVAEREILNHVRFVALNCRSAARTDLFKACATLAIDKPTARVAHVETFVKCLSQATGKSPVFYRPGVENLSFDEAWMMRLVRACQTEDGDSFRFLLHSRVVPQARRNLGFLISAMSDQFGQD